MNKGFKPRASFFDATTAREMKTLKDNTREINVRMQDEIRLDRNNIEQLHHSDKTIERLSDFWRISSVYLDKRLMTCVMVDNNIEDHEITHFEPTNMSDDTHARIFGDRLRGEVHVDGAVVLLHRLSDRQGCEATLVEGELPGWCNIGGTWSNSTKLANAIADQCRIYYAKKRAPVPDPEPKDLKEALTRRKWETADTLMKEGFKALLYHAKGWKNLDDETIDELVAQIKRANGLSGYIKYSRSQKEQNHAAKLDLAWRLIDG